jgi:hypothetical protein
MKIANVLSILRAKRIQFYQIAGTNGWNVETPNGWTGADSTRAFVKLCLSLNLVS